MYFHDDKIMTEGVMVAVRIYISTLTRALLTRSFFTWHKILRHLFHNLILRYSSISLISSLSLKGLWNLNPRMFRSVVLLTSLESTKKFRVPVYSEMQQPRDAATYLAFDGLLPEKCQSTPERKQHAPSSRVPIRAQTVLGWRLRWRCL